MSKRNQRSSSSSSTQSRPSPKRNKLLGATPDGDTESCSMDKTPDDRPSLERIMEKLSYLDNRIEEHFGGLKSDISILRHELKEEIEGVKSTLTGVEKSLESAWNVDCKTVRIFVYSSTREQSNKRSKTRLKTEGETGERR